MKAFKRLLYLMVAATLTVGTFSCSSDDPDPDKGEEVKPDAKVDDPVGTVALTMRNGNNGETHLGNIYIGKDDNFAGGEFVDLGQMKGLGNVASIPRAGWASKVAVRPGHGYVAYSGGEFYRIYVVDYVLEAVTQGIIGAEIKYQKPFAGLNEELQMDTKALTFGEEGGTEGIVISNRTIVPFTVSSSEDWCVVSPASTTDKYFLTDAIQIEVLPNTTTAVSTAEVTVKTLWNKEAKITVTRAGQAPFFEMASQTDFNLDAVGGTYSVAFNSNIPVEEISATPTADWLEVQPIDFIGDVRRAGARIRFVGEKARSKAYGETGEVHAYAMKVIAAKNYGPERSASVNVTAKTFANEIKFAQNGLETEIGETTEFRVSYMAGSRTINLRANVPDGFTARSDASWCRATMDGSVARSSYGLQIIAEYEANTGKDERAAHIDLTAPDGTRLATYTIVQEGASIVLDGSVNLATEPTLYTDRNSKSITLTVASAFEDWTPVIDGAWLTYSLNGNQMTIRMGETSETRDATVRFGETGLALKVRQIKYAAGDTYTDEGEAGQGQFIGMEPYTGLATIIRELDGKYQWSTENVATGATFTHDGMENWEVITSIPGYEDFYPVFGAVEQKLNQSITGWYIPATSDNLYGYRFKHRETYERALYAFSNEASSDKAYGWDTWNRYVISYGKQGNFYVAAIRKVQF